jgi:hypothetical protein
MRAAAVAALLLVTAIAFIMATAAQVFTADVVRPHSAFAALLITSLITSGAALAIDIDVPR